ncbi:MAG TPA: nucleotidyl transferase AbiEii/AbiGii toxin family protein [Bacteroidales bacterium]|nr:nucleotidyl transferase AbiEii/AbiGii toxin family protein [Bacteroidales bacterium]
MIQIDLIRPYFPKIIQDSAVFGKYMIKEYIQLMILEYLSTSPFIKKLTFIGGTNLRLVKGIDRFSEDLDFDCKDFSENEFIDMSEKVLLFLKRNGLNAEFKSSENKKLKAYRSNIYFPGLMFQLGLTAHREERFLIKIESQDQKVLYKPVTANIKGCGFYFPFPVPPDGVLCSMKLSALLSRSKGRDFYDAMFLLQQTVPDYDFLQVKVGISNLKELKKALLHLISTVDLKHKAKDFEHLVFHESGTKKILRFNEFVNALILDAEQR